MMLLLMFKAGNHTGMDGFVSRKVHFPTIGNQKYPTNGGLRDKGAWKVLFFLIRLASKASYVG